MALFILFFTMILAEHFTVASAQDQDLLVKYPKDYPEKWREEWDNAINNARAEIRKALGSKSTISQTLNRSKTCGREAARRIDKLCPEGCSFEVNLFSMCHYPMSDAELQELCCGAF